MRIARKSQENPELDSRKLAWLTYKEVVKRGAEMMMPIYEASHGRYGWISGQLDPRLFTEVDQMVTDADELRAIHWAFERGEAAGRATETMPQSRSRTRSARRGSRWG